MVLQLVLVVNGAATLLPESAPPLATRLGRFVCYFTVLSNVLVVVVEARCARGLPDSRAWRVVRLDALVGIAVTGLVHFVLLRPLLDLHGASYVADRLLHVVVPVLTVALWLVLGPRRMAGRSDVGWSLAFPGLWLLGTLAHGAVTGWYPYPFVDVGRHGWGSVLLASLGIAVLFAALGWAAVLADPRLPVRRGASGTTPRRPTGRT